jgi:hypothetical protein
MKFISMQFSPRSIFLPFRSKYLPQHCVLKTLSPCSFLKVRDQVSHPYSTTVKITVLYILIFERAPGTHWIGGRYGRGGEEKNSQPLSGLELPIIRPEAQRYATELSRRPAPSTSVRLGTLFIEISLHPMRSSYSMHRSICFFVLCL